MTALLDFMAIDQNQKARFFVVLADDNKGMGDNVIRFLEDEFEVVGAVSDGRTFVDAVSKIRPDVGDVDISMPVINGIGAAA